MFVPLLFTPFARGRRWVAPLAFAGTAAALFGTWLAAAGWRGIYQVITFRGAHGWQIESSVGSIFNLLGSPLRFESGSWRTGAMALWMSSALFAAAAPICLWMIRAGARTGRIGLAWLGSVSTLLVLSPLLSAQFMIWATPAAAVAYVEGERRRVAMALAAVILTGAFMQLYEALLSGNSVVATLVVARNVLLAVLAADVIRSLTAQR